MGLGGISIWQLAIVLLIVVLIFGTKRLKSIGSDLGGAIKGFKKSMDTDDKPSEERQKHLENEEQDAEFPERRRTRAATPSYAVATMFDVGFQEIVLVSIIGLLVLGPQRFPKVAAEIGKWVGRARRTATQLRRQLEREIELSEVETPPRRRRPSATPSSPAASAAGTGEVPPGPGTHADPPDAVATRLRLPVPGAARRADPAELMSPPPDKHEPEEPLAEGTLISHLLELRSRIMKAVLAVIVALLGLMPFMNTVFEYVSKPLREALPEGSEMIVTDVAAPFLVPFKTVFFVAIFIAMPVVLFQVWQFVAPGLYKREKRFAIPLMASSIVLFYAGIAFAYFLVFRVMFAFFASVTPDGVAMTPDISAYLSFVLGIFLAFGLAFEVPIATVC